MCAANAIWSIYVHIYGSQTAEDLPEVIPVESIDPGSVCTYLSRLTTPSELGGRSIYVRGLENH